ncbi:nicotinate-nucleotide--dimethylbenzimidazole phosphoribosyltransferase [Streptomyces sp. NPDC050145]|uniref:nicotinate-nucleotide--dimethylbenzimidazole phosphoribosyltransferase n=1 Tax=Streptomyces sp. NPDC050145 TaxID=3365602 RepID=UPI0037A2AB53
MTETGQVPGEGLPENAGGVDQPGVPAPGAYTYLDPADAVVAEDDELLLMPGSQGAWGQPHVATPPHQQQPGPAVVHEPGPHETAGRDSGHHDLGAMQMPQAQAPSQGGPRRPLHMGPPVPETGTGPVRSLADRGPAQQTPPQAMPMHQSGPPTTGPEYLDVPPQGAAPWQPAGAQPQQAGYDLAGGMPVAAAETVVPEAVPAQYADHSGQFPHPQGPGAAQDFQPVPGQQPVGAYAGQPEPVVAYAGAPDTQAAQGAQPFAVEQPLGQFVPVEGSLPTTPHLAPTPPQAMVVPPLPEPEAEQPVAEQPVAAQQVAEQAPAEQGAAGQPVAEQPVAEQPVPEQQVAEQAPAEQGAAGQPVAEQPVAEQPVPEQQVAEQVLAEQPIAEQPVAEQPVPGQPVVEQPAGEQLVAEQQVVEAVAEVPAQQPVAEPVAEDPQTEQAEQVEQAQQPQAQAQPQPVEPEQPAQEQHAQVQQAQPGQNPEPQDVQAQELQGQGPQIQEQAAEPAPQVQEAPAEPEAQEQPGPETGQPIAAEAVVTEPAAEQPAAEAQDAAEAAPVAEQPAEEPVAAVPAPRDGAADESEPAQSADDLPTAEGDAEPEPTLAGPAAPAYDDAEREAVLRVMRERRDIRNGFRSDPIPHEVLLRVLEAAHTAPSVGHSQPWDFVVIRSADTRRTMHELAERQRDAYAKSLPKGRAKQFKELKIEAILDTPVNIVVTADPTRGGRHTLGRHTQPQMAPYSSALAVENLWLAARAEGLGVGWVSFFDEREMVRTLGLPEHLEVVAYLCVGYVDEFPAEPELMQAGWSKRRPLSWVVHEETYGRRALPGEDPHDLLAETVSNIRPLDAKALGEAWERQKRMTKPAGALGMLEIISAQLSGLSRMCPPPIPEPAAVAIFAGDHGVHAQGVTPWPQEVTGQMVANFLGGGAVCNAFANQVGAEVCVIDVGVASELPATPGLLPRKVRAGTSDMTTGPALTREEVKAAIEVGIETARDLVAAGNKALLTGEMGIANTTASAALISVYTEVDPAEVTGRGTGINDETHARKVEVVRRALELHQPDPADPIGVLAAVGGLEHAALVGLLLGGASLRTPVILDGVSAGAAALVARAVAPEVLAACIAGHRSAEPGHVAALNKLGLRPLIDLDLRLGEGTGALLALPIVQSAARAMHEVATFDSAGVTEK